MADKMKVLLIGPTALDYYGKPIKQRKLHLPGLTLPMLAAVTPDDTVDLKIMSETVEDIPWDEHWDLVGLTGMGSGIVRAWQIADEFKRRKRTVVIGGIAASLDTGKRSLNHADCLVSGEAEEVWPKVLEDFAAGRLQREYKMEKRPDIKTLPLPRYDKLNAKKLGVWRPVQATRGCPFPCSFCSIQSFFQRTYRKRPVEEVLRDVRAAKATGTRYIAFIDDNIGVDWNYCQDLWEALIPEKIIWMSQCSLHIADKPDMMKLAYESGCRMLSFGIESTDWESLVSIQKTFNHPEKYGDAVKALRKHGIEVSTEMIIGLDNDDESVFQRTFDFIMDNKISVPRVHIMTPIPGTQMYKDLEEEGRIISQDWNKFSGGNVVFRPKKISPEKLQDGYWKLYENLFTRRNIFKRVGGNPAGLNPYLRAFFIGANLHYRGHIKKRITPGIV